MLAKTLKCVDESLSDAKLNANQIDKVVLVGGASRTPLVHQLLEEQLGQPVHAEVDPDLCVAMGAAIQGGLIAGIDVGPVLVDITPHTLGIQASSDVDGRLSHYCFAPLIERNTPLPARRSEIFSTVFDGQKAVRIAVFQGEDDDVRHNDPVGEFLLDGLADVDARQRDPRAVRPRPGRHPEGQRHRAGHRPAEATDDRQRRHPLPRRQSPRGPGPRGSDVLRRHGRDAGGGRSWRPQTRLAPARPNLPAEMVATHRPLRTVDRQERATRRAIESGGRRRDAATRRATSHRDGCVARRPTWKAVVAQLEDLVFYLQDA